MSRDIKLENFVLKFENDFSSIKLIDFGLARRLKEKELFQDPYGSVIEIIVIIKI